MIEIIPVETPSLGDRGYLVTDGKVAFVVDPQRDIDRVLRLAERRGVEIRHVFETHVHNDYVTGGPALASATGADYHVNAADPVEFDRCPIEDGDVVEIGPRTRLRAVATPGHTFTHLSYVLECPDRPPAVFTGGSLLHGTTGRPDLLGPEHTGALARAQHASAHRLARELPAETGVFPTHGFGSFCSAAQSDVTESTIGRELRVNPVLTRGEDEYVKALLAGLDVYPAYYAHMAPLNLAGPDAPDLSPPRHADAAELHRRLRAGEWVVDLRSRTAFASGHLAGTLNFGLDGNLAVYLGWLLPWGTPVTLLGETPGDIARAQRELARIGIDRPAAAATGGPAEWAGDDKPASMPSATFADLAAVRRSRPIVVLDVRREIEWRGSHLPGAIHIPLHELPARLGEVPDGEVWTHCASGYRASIAASILAAAGRDVVAVHDAYDGRAAAA
ncbi:MBL fold metallo-hydrolase [Microbispora hainanensis]|jgi:glyoxylase-like metal-dependent hydrolase (beta-lactamase superfamily II)/rhodanese-related sulfurtransferase|uniref:MBL fold metallo-hydrolase n=1 Tax=Microbispora hainanensis TaxID=568844 RepID=A0ABZ1SZI3_9ACTN|nr:MULTISPECIES: MBL fold metallo-hydrolase [Microbispora]NJP26030.1 MBL fold metallo-hydrolase [Microbispora sp. CL1-1]TQS12806.1 MBL fold metallo-hydrolase [Microbispora sp. SCL1-1]